MFVAVNRNAPGGDPNRLRLVFDEHHAVTLAANAINRIDLEQGFYRLVLPELPQEDDNAVIRYRFSAGDVYRFALVERRPPVADTLAARENPSPATYAIVPSTRDAYQQLLLESELPLVEHAD